MCLRGLDGAEHLHDLAVFLDLIVWYGTVAWAVVHAERERDGRFGIYLEPLEHIAGVGEREEPPLRDVCAARDGVVEAQLSSAQIQCARDLGAD